MEDALAGLLIMLLVTPSAGDTGPTARLLHLAMDGTAYQHTVPSALEP